MTPDEQAIRERCEAAKRNILSSRPMKWQRAYAADVPTLLDLLVEQRAKVKRLRERCDLYELAWARLSMHERVELQRLHAAAEAGGG